MRDISIQQSKIHTIGHQVQLRFRIAQHARDIKLMEFLKKYMGAGYIKNNKTGMVTLTITKISYLFKIIIPFFEKYPLIGVKQ
jgi:hypothetical protein